ncbi:MAG: DUF1415 domain-containing protein [Pseudomonadales bacterium]|jgi:hypothetical protein|nr:DUF1415 domain-containing protein [Pseudomonadales bacterium]
MDEAEVVSTVEHWLSQFVIGLNLCPFARRVSLDGGIRYKVTLASTEAELSQALEVELNLLLATPSIETTLLIHPNVLGDFYDYNEYLSETERLLKQPTFDGIFQIASFHPDYQFAGTEPGDAENYSNRTPYPLLHLLREDSVTKAVDSYPDIESIPANNLRRLNNLSRDVLQEMWLNCLS